MQYFKGDDDEKKVVDAGRTALDATSTALTAFSTGALETARLGDVIYDSGRSPLSNAIDREIFRLSFAQIFQAFIEVGSFESYITVFKKIFGQAATVTFTVPAPGKLTIDIDANVIETNNFVARYIEDNAYVFDQVVTQDGDNIVFQTIKGFQSQYELEKMLFEMVPNGIYTTINLDLGA